MVWSLYRLHCSSLERANSFLLFLSVLFCFFSCINLQKIIIQRTKNNIKLSKNRKIVTISKISIVVVVSFSFSLFFVLFCFLFACASDIFYSVR